MSSHSRPAAPHLEPVRVGNLYRLAIVGAASLKGKEVAEALNDRNFPSIDIKLLDDDESLEMCIRDRIRDVRYQRGQFLNAMNSASAEHNEQNTVTVEGEGHAVVFKQIAGLLARRIVFTKKVGDRVERGERIGLIKFGSRVDVLLEPSATPQIKVGDRVKGGSTVLAYLGPESAPVAASRSEPAQQGVR